MAQTTMDPKNMGIYLINKKDLRSFAQKMTELEHFLFGPAEFSDI